MSTYSADRKIPLRLRSAKLTQSNIPSDIEVRRAQRSGGVSETKYSIIIVGYNEGEKILDLIRGVIERINQSIEVIFVDNGLDEAVTADIRKYGTITYIKTGQNIGCSTARNIGAAYAVGDIIIFIDGDGLIHEDTFTNIDRLFAGMPDTIALRGRVRPREEKEQLSMPSHYDLGRERLKSFIDAEGISAWKRNVFCEVGGFEDSLAGGEGIVLCYRMVEIYGYPEDQFIYDPSIILFHDFASTQEKREYKLRQNKIFLAQANLRYPFMQRFIDSYAKVRTHTPEDRGMAQERSDDIDSDKARADEKKARQKMSEDIREDDSPNFSVIIPCYNLGEYVENAVSSIEGQTLGNVEIIIVDDASSDKETKKVLKKLEGRVRVVYLKENGGVSAARNKGVVQAASEYILCLDADDTIDERYLEMAKNVFDADDTVDIVSCDVNVWGESDWVWKPMDVVSMRDALVSSPIPTASCFRKTAHVQGGGYDEKLRGYEDWDHWIRIMKQGGKVRVIPHILFHYFSRPGSKVKTSNKNSQALMAMIVDNHEDLYAEHHKYIILKKHEQWLNVDNALKEARQSQVSGGGKENFIQVVTRHKKKFFPDKIMR